ncbi:hypothetical protein F5B20DRAFT_465344 [Whalleya microplaca]|nr:hypothetical protein F5B20DRAFT_465344 [Whalleya microplaca]
MRKKLLLYLRQYNRCAVATEENGSSRKSYDSILRGKIYVADLPPDIEPIRKFLEKYCGIRAKDVDGHIHSIRDRLWDIYPYANIGHFRFLSLQFTSDPCYQLALQRLLVPNSKTTFLDLACCVGQVLRQLAFDGVDSTRLYGTDVEPRFLEAGYDLFRDRAKFKATFVAGDLLSQGIDGSGDERLNVLDGKMSIIHASCFFHLFTWEKQVRAARRIIRFLDSNDPAVMIFGRHVGTTTPGDKENSWGENRFLHNAASWQELWDEVGRLTGTAWRTELITLEDASVGLHRSDDIIRRIRFGVFRA